MIRNFCASVTSNSGDRRERGELDRGHSIPSVVGIMYFQGRH